MAKNTPKLEQDKNELKKMAEFYAQNYSEVYFVRCLKSDHIIAVECAPARTDKPTVERALKDRNIFGYQEQFMTTRYRLDRNANDHRMVGYECACGNDTRLSDHERGIVPESRVTRSQASKGDAPRPINLSPFERAMLESAVQSNQANSKSTADYESGMTKDGYQFERFESFQVERVA